MQMKSSEHQLNYENLEVENGIHHRTKTMLYYSKMMNAYKIVSEIKRALVLHNLAISAVRSRVQNVVIDHEERKEIQIFPF